MRLSTWLILVPALVLGVALAVANRSHVLVGLDPFDRDAPALAVEAPLFLVMFACLLAGILLGGLVTWLAGAPVRRQVRLHARELKRLQANAPQPTSAPAPAPAATPAAPAAPVPAPLP
jgi:uncharacterized integral membrane protein